MVIKLIIKISEIKFVRFVDSFVFSSPEILRYADEHHRPVDELKEKKNISSFSNANKI